MATKINSSFKQNIIKKSFIGITLKYILAKHQIEVLIFIVDIPCLFSLPLPKAYTDASEVCVFPGAQGLSAAAPGV
jgi:hypothetical protein